MPGALIAAVLSPFGGEGLGLWISSIGLRWILFVARWVSELEGAIRPVVQPDIGVLVVLTVGSIFFILWRGGTRFFGLIPVFAGFFLWTQTERPFVLISDSGGLLGIMTDQGRALSRERGDGFVAGVWLENDGDLADQATASQRWESLLQPPVRHVRGKRAVAEMSCKPQDIIVTDRHPPENLPCRIFSPETLRETGSISIDRTGHIKTARDHSGARRWHPWFRGQ